MNIPVITLEVQAMKHTMKTLLTKYAMQIDTEIQAAVDEFCTPENVKRIVKEAAKSAIQSSIADQVQGYFKYGAGREQVAAAVREQLELKTNAETVKVSDIVEYYGGQYTVVAKGENPGTFDLVAYPDSKAGDSWRNVASSKLQVLRS